MWLLEGCATSYDPGPTPQKLKYNTTDKPPPAPPPTEPVRSQLTGGWSLDYLKDKFNDPIPSQPYVAAVIEGITCSGSVEVSYKSSDWMVLMISRGDSSPHFKSISGELAITFSHSEYTYHRGYGGFTTVSIKDQKGNEYTFKGDRSEGIIFFRDYHIPAKNNFYNTNGTGRPRLLAALLAKEEPLKVHISAASTISATCSGVIAPYGIRNAMIKMGIKTLKDLKKFNIPNSKKR